MAMTLEDIQRDPDSIYKAADLPKISSKIPKTEQEAAEMYYKAALKGHPLSQYKLAKVLEEGLGYSKDEAKAVFWYRRSALQGNPAAQCDLGRMLLYGRGIPKDEKQAFEWFWKAEKENWHAQYYLALMYLYGLGILKDEKRAAEFFHKVAEAGFGKYAAESKFLLGMLYLKGKGVKKDIKQAKSWFQKAAEKKHVLAQHTLGVMFENENNIEQAASWYCLASIQGYEPSRKALRALEMKAFMSENPAASSFPQIGLEETKLDSEKPWHFDKSVDIPREESKEGFSILDAGRKDIEKVIEAYQRCPVAGYEVARVHIIYNPTLQNAFRNRLLLLQQRYKMPAFEPKFYVENDKEWRENINEVFEKLSASYKDSDCPNVKILPLWHGTRKEILPSLFKTGFANLASTDSGYFGKGLYSAYEADYSYRIYSKGALLLNWVSYFSAYPVIDGDMRRLFGGANYANYDAHVAPVVPEFPEDPRSMSYIPCKPGEQPKYTEVVVFESSQCLPRYLVELQPTLRGSADFLYSYLSSKVKQAIAVKEMEKEKEKKKEKEVSLVKVVKKEIECLNELPLLEAVAVEEVEEAEVEVEVEAEPELSLVEDVEYSSKQKVAMLQYA